MVICAVVAHKPAVGVNVQVVVAVLLSAGDQVPVIPLFEVVGRAANVPPEQIGATCVKVGTTFGFMVIVKVLVAPTHPNRVKTTVIVADCGVATVAAVKVGKKKVFPLAGKPIAGLLFVQETES